MLAPGDTISIPAWLPNFLVGAFGAAIPTLYTLIKQHITTKLLEGTVRKLHERVDDINKALAKFDKNLLVIQTREEAMRELTPIRGVPTYKPRERTGHFKTHSAVVREEIFDNSSADEEEDKGEP